MSGEGDPDGRFAALKREYSAEVPAKVDEIAAAIEEAERSGAPDALARATSLAHRLAGTAGSYGLPDVGDRAGAVEDALRDVGAGGWQRVRAALERLVAISRC